MLEIWDNGMKFCTMYNDMEVCTMFGEFWNNGTEVCTMLGELWYNGMEVLYHAMGVLVQWYGGLYHVR